MIKVRRFEESNYHAIYCNGKTMRIAIDDSKPITELKYPEFLDVAITHFCSGNCQYCYMDAKNSGKHVENIVDKLDEYFGHMTQNQRPFQVALGGAGNPNEHPDFPSVLTKFDDLGITPNYTTNGMGLTDEVIEATKKYCGGVAVSCHPHLEKIWKAAAIKLLDAGVKTALHHIISDKQSVDNFFAILGEFPDVSYHVLLPLIGQGRAKEVPVENEYLFDKLLDLPKDQMKKIAFGAKFYPELCKRKKDLNVSLYEPEILSKYLDMADMKIYNSSFETVI